MGCFNVSVVNSLLNHCIQIVSINIFFNSLQLTSLSLFSSFQIGLKIEKPLRKGYFNLLINSAEHTLKKIQLVRI